MRAECQLQAAISAADREQVVFRMPEGITSMSAENQRMSFVRQNEGEISRQAAIQSLTHQNERLSAKTIELQIE